MKLIFKIGGNEMIIESNILMQVRNNDIGPDGCFMVPDNITEIGSCAFWGCNLLQDLVIPEGVTKIGDHSFVYCKKLQKVEIPASVVEIDNYAFLGCESLQKIEISEGVTTIGKHSFANCKSLQEVEIPVSVTEIGNYTFDACENLSKIEWRGKIYPIKCVDGNCMHIRSRKMLQDITIMKCSYFPNEEIVYVAEKGEYTAHGKTLREAVADLQFKIMDNIDPNEHIHRIAQQGYMNANDYRLLTGACREGTNRFLEANNLTWEDTMSVEDVLQLTKGQYGFERFKNIAEQILKLM